MYETTCLYNLFFLVRSCLELKIHGVAHPTIVAMDWIGEALLFPKYLPLVRECCHCFVVVVA